MQDVLALLNIQVSYKERISQIGNLMKQKNHKELNLTVMSSTLKYEQNTYVKYICNHTFWIKKFKKKC